MTAVPSEAQAARQRASSDMGLIVTLGLLVLVLALASMIVGRVPLAFVAAVTQLMAGENSTAAMILGEIRFPRALLAALVGATLGVAGAAMQGLLRNPLAEPGILGVSASAGLGAVIALYFGFAQASSFALPVAGMAGALVAVLLTYVLAGRDASILTLILAGVALNAFAGALTSLALNLAPSPYAALEIVFWLLGSLADRSFDHVRIALPLMVVGAVLLAGTGRALNALSLGEDVARSLGINLRIVRARLILGTAVAVGAAVSVSGTIGFVGLVVPHLIRPLVGHEPGRLMLPSALGGAALVLAADIATRLVPVEPDLQLGVVTAIVGAPFFLYLLLHIRRSMR
ncbi:MAG: iron ABC transporter permease [Alphaproteobacteria bacterium]